MDLTWIDRSGRNCDGDLIKAESLVDVDGRVLADVAIPITSCEDFVATLYLDYPYNGDRRYMDLEHAKQFCENQVHEWAANEPTRIAIDAARTRAEHERYGITPKQVSKPENTGTVFGRIFSPKK